WYDQMGGSHARQAGWERKSGTDGPWSTALLAATVAVAGPGGQQGAAGLPRRGTTPGQESAAVVCGWACAVRGRLNGRGGCRTMDGPLSGKRLQRRLWWWTASTSTATCSGFM